MTLGDARTTWFSLQMACLLGAAGIGGPGLGRGEAAVFTVTTASDSGAGSLRQAILDANASAGADLITFNLSGSGPHSIPVYSNLPPVLEAVTLDGGTQPGFAGKPWIELRAAGSDASHGLRLWASGCVVRSLCINRFSAYGISINNVAGSNIVQGCYIGTGIHGTNALGNVNGGLYISTPGNLIGGTNAAERNVISGNGHAGLYIVFAGARENQVSGNYIGLDATGTKRLGNVENGITIISAPDNVVGGRVSGAGNVISGNGQSGVYILNWDASGNRVLGNFIGTDATGMLTCSNSLEGISLVGATATTVGGTNAGDRNVISGNTQRGIYLTTGSDKPGGGTNNLISGNYIGIKATGNAVLANGLSGVELYKAAGNTVGISNVISGNRGAGVTISHGSSTNNRVIGNWIGTDASGLGGLGNYFDGVLITGASNNVVGGTTLLERNVIAANAQTGVLLLGATTRSNAILGNYIGVDRAGAGDLGNALSGVWVEGANNIVGSSQAGAGNLISGNVGNGVFLVGAGASNNVIAGNVIGLAADGVSPVGNSVAGISISNAPRNVIGGTTAAARNVLSANGNSGIGLTWTNATGNVIQGNYIGTDVSGTRRAANGYGGVYAYGAPANILGGGTPGAGNVISGNALAGVSIGPPAAYASDLRLRANGWIIQGNKIGTKVDGVGALPNGNSQHNIEILAPSSGHMIGGPNPGEGNWIAHTPTSAFDGVRIRDGATNNLVAGNAIWANGGASTAGLGIDLGPDGVTANDACDPDSGANQLQNFPVLSVAYASVEATVIRGLLNSITGKDYAIDFYANATNEPSGYGEGQVYLGRVSIRTPASGCVTNFTARLSRAAPVGCYVTATATDITQNTSEFSQGVRVSPQPGISITNLTATGPLLLAWTNAAPEFVLQQATNLNSPVVWLPVAQGPAVSNGQYVVTLPTTNGSRFFRLMFQ